MNINIQASFCAFCAFFVCCLKGYEVVKLHSQHERLENEEWSHLTAQMDRVVLEHVNMPVCVCVCVCVCARFYLFLV